MMAQRLMYGCGVVVLVSLLNGGSLAEMSAAGDPINALYENLLEREYAGPISFPERVERKAQRSPSLRLRFGRSDPNIEMDSTRQKRWFGDVDQKPIRSPSLRLRFGRSDPSLSNSWDQNDLQHINQEDRIVSRLNTEKLINILENIGVFNELQNNPDEYQREIRKQTPLRLRFGRSAGVSQAAATNQAAPEATPEGADKA